MEGLSLILQSALACVLVLLALLSVQLAVLGLMRLYRPAPRIRVPHLPDEALPRVLVQLPVCDEGALAVRVATAAAMKRASGHSSGQISGKPLPFSNKPRTIRRKWVTGSTSPMACAQPGIPKKGKAKPESRIEGNRKNTIICIA
jgi:hypothetical protein